MLIILNGYEFEYLLSGGFVSNSIVSVIKKAKKTRKNQYAIELEEELVDQLHEELEDRLQLVGFDEAYDITEEGKKIENLIDKIFIEQGD